MTNKRGRERGDIRQRQRVWRGREIPWEGEKQRLRGRKEAG